MESVREEVRRSPLSLLLSALNAAAAIAAVVVALKQGGASFASPPSTQAPAASSYLIAIAGFLSITTTSALIARFIHSQSGVASYFASVVIGSLATLLTSLVIRTQGVHFGRDTELSANSQIVYWGTLLIFLAINAEQVTEGYKKWNRTTLKEGTYSDDEAMGAALMLALLLVAWAVALWKGQVLLTSHLG